jgi:hypothetical protein
MALPPTAAPSIIPSPDPSRLTLEVLHRELQLHKELAASERAVLTAELHAMQKASELLEAKSNQVPTILDREIKRVTDSANEKFTSVSDLFKEKFSGVETQFGNMKEMSAAMLGNMKEFSAAMRGAADTAIAAAFAAADKVINAQNTANMQASAKSEQAFTDRIRAIENLLSLTKETVNIDINAVKDRLTKQEAIGTGARDSRDERRSDMGSTVAIVVATATVVGVLMVILEFALRH